MYCINTWGWKTSTLKEKIMFADLVVQLPTFGETGRLLEAKCSSATLISSGGLLP
jgi:hypothetical protein